MFSGERDTATAIRFVINRERYAGCTRMSM